MRRVLRNRNEVCHFWANRRQSEGRASRVFFEGDTIYSYGRHFPMARLMTDGAGSTVAVFTTRRYSSSTAQHISYAEQAAFHHRRIYVLHPTASAFSQSSETLRKVRELLDKASRARQNKPWLLAQAATKVKYFNEYAELCGEGVRLYDPALVGIDEQIAAAEAAEAERIAKAQAQYEADNAEAIAEWRAGKRGYCPRTASPMLRIRNGLQPLMVETSWGADIPTEEAERLWPVIQRVMAGDRDYEVGMKLGGWHLTKIRRDGSIVVGCHDIPFAEIEGIAKQLDLLETQPA